MGLLAEESISAMRKARTEDGAFEGFFEDVIAFAEFGELVGMGRRGDAHFVDSCAGAWRMDLVKKRLAAAREASKIL